PATARSSASLPDSHSRSQAWGIPINYLSAGQRRRAGTDQDRQTVQRHHSSQPARTHRAQQGTCQLSHRAIYFVEAVRKTPTNFGRTCFLSEKKLQISDRGATMNDLKTQIMAHIDAAAPDQVWVPADFSQLGGRDAVDKALQRLVTAAQLRRIDRGLYDRPRVNGLTKQATPPDYRAVVDAIARRDQLRLLVDGMTAANDLGLTDAVPANVIIHTDARRRTIQLDNLTI